MLDPVFPVLLPTLLYSRRTEGKESWLMGYQSVKRLAGSYDAGLTELDFGSRNESDIRLPSIR